MIAGLEDITRGEIYIDGKLVNDAAPKDRDIAMVFQSYALYPHLTVFENMAFSLRARKFPQDEIKERVERTAELLRIRDLLIVHRGFFREASANGLRYARELLENRRFF